jgi:integrase
VSTTAAPRKDPKTGTWWFVVDLPPDVRGRRRQAKRRGFPTKKAALEALDELRSAARRGTFVAPQRQTLRAFLVDDWLPAMRRELEESTWEDYERKVRLHVVPYLGGAQLQTIDAGSLNRLYANLLAGGRRDGRPGGLSPRTVRYIHAILHGALDDAVKWRRIPVNPADQANPPSARSAKAPEKTVWSREQLRRFLELSERDGGPDGPEPEFARARHRFHFVWLFLATSGCRRGEVLGLRWRDISFDEATAAIRQTVVPLRKAGGHGREARIKPWTKTGRARVIELDRQTLAALRTWRAHQAEERLLVGSAYEDNDLVFCRPDGRPYQPEYFSKMFDRTLGRLPYRDELPRIRLHDLRHTWATLALVAGVDVRIVSERLGHSSPLITWQTYQHVIKGMQSDAAEKVAALIFGPA